MTDPVVYSAVLTSIFASCLGIGVSFLVLRRVWVYRARPRPAITVLLASLFGVSVGQLTEQIRVLIFRLSYDRFISDDVFAVLYTSVWGVAASKVIFAMSLSVAAAVQLGLYCDREDVVVLRWAIGAAAATLGLWWVVAVVFDAVT